METALVTGATSGIGEAITQMLLDRGYKVYGVGRDFSKALVHENFEAIVCDLEDVKAIETMGKSITEPLDLLVNCAGFGRFDPLEEMSASMIQRMIAVNLQAPILITSTLLRSLKKQQGTIINITSIEAIKHSKFASVYSATKAGLRSFGLSLFEEVRKAGVKVVTINPDMTKTPFFDDLHFEPHGDENTHLLPETVAKAIENIITMPKSSVISELTIRPQVVRIQKR